MALTQCRNLQEIYDVVKEKKPFPASQITVRIEQIVPGNRFGHYSYMACQYYGKYLCRRAINPEQNGNTPARHQFGMRTPAERDEEEGSHICGEWGAQKAWMFHVRCSDSSILFRDTRLMPKCIVFQAGDSIFGMSAADFAQRNQTEQIRLTENAMKGVWILIFQRNGEPRRRTSLDKSKKADILVSAARRPPLPPTQSLFVDGASSSCANSKAPKSPHLSEVSEDNMAMLIILSSDSGDDEDTVESFRKKLEKCSIKIPKKEPGINDTEEKVGRLLRAHRVVLNEMAEHFAEVENARENLHGSFLQVEQAAEALKVAQMKLRDKIMEVGNSASAAENFLFRL